MTSTEEELIGLARAWMVAAQQKDLAALERILAPEYTYTATSHGRQSRQEWLRRLAEYTVDRFRFVDLEVQEYGDVAVVLSHYQQEATVAGVPRSGDFLITDVWVRRDGDWQVVARSSIMQPAAPTA